MSPRLRACFIAWLAITSAVVVIALPVKEAVRERQQRTMFGCLKQIDGAVQQWALEQKTNRPPPVPPEP